MQCPVCETPNRLEAKYCRRCGAALTAPPTVATVAETQRTFRAARQMCVYCGASLRADARFCAQCGHPVGTPVPPSPSPASPYEGFAQPLSGYSASRPTTGEIQSVQPDVEFAAVAYPDIPTPASQPTRRRNLWWLWLVAAVVLCILVTVLAVGLAMYFDLLPGL